VKLKPRLILCGIALAISCITGASAQSSDTPDETSVIESLRADLRADKTKIITAVMQFSQKDADAFWPVYRKFEADRSKLEDQHIALIKEYATSYTSLTDEQAQSLTQKALDYQEDRVDLEKKYFKEFSKVLSGVTVAKFFQLEHRLNLLVDLELAAHLPAVFQAKCQYRLKFPHNSG
jgi:hypothetical protein